MKSHALMKWSQRGKVSSPSQSGIDKRNMREVEDDDMDLYAYGGPVEPRRYTPDFSLTIMQNPGVGTSEGDWDEEKDLQDPPDMDGMPLGRRSRSFSKGGFVDALRNRRRG